MRRKLAGRDRPSARLTLRVLRVLWPLGDVRLSQGTGCLKARGPGLADQIEQLGQHVERPPQRPFLEPNVPPHVPFFVRPLMQGTPGHVIYRLKQLADCFFALFSDSHAVSAIISCMARCATPWFAPTFGIVLLTA
jgi:hypothetical protein